MVRRTREDMEKTRASLLRSARKAFADQGFAETSMDDLTAKVGLTRGALYHHFGDKKGLLAAVVALIDDEMDVRLNEISDSAEDPWEGFYGRCNAYLEMALEPEIQRIVLRDARSFLGSSSPAGQVNCVASLARLIQGLLNQNRIAEVDPQAAALMIYGSLAESAFWIAERDSEERLVQCRSAMDLLLKGFLLR